MSGRTPWRQVKHKRKHRHVINSKTGKPHTKCCEWCLWAKQTGDWQKYTPKKYRNDCCCYAHNTFEITMVRTEDARRSQS